MPGSPRKKGGEVPVKATGKQKARPTNRGKARRYTQTVVSARGGEDGRDSSGRKRGMGRRSSEEEKRDSSLRGPARKQRAQEKTGAESAGWGGGPQRKRREIPPYAARRANNARKKKPGRSVRNDGMERGAGCPAFTGWAKL